MNTDPAPFSFAASLRLVLPGVSVGVLDDRTGVCLMSLFKDLKLKDFRVTSIKFDGSEEISFGRFRLDLRRRELLRNDRLV